jgi:hypothetical protein
MKVLCAVVVTFVLAAAAQTAQPAPQPPQQAQNPPVDLNLLLATIEQTSGSSVAQIQAMRIDKWKTDSSQKQRAQQNAESLVRNLQAALPTMVAAARQQPQSFSANFKLYRNLAALYDVMLPLTESAGAFGQKGEFQAIGEQLQRWDEIRRNYGDYLEQLAARKDAAQAAAQSAPAKPKKIIVDDTAPSTAKKKKQK